MEVLGTLSNVGSDWEFCDHLVFKHCLSWVIIVQHEVWVKLVKVLVLESSRTVFES